MMVALHVNDYLAAYDLSLLVTQCIVLYVILPMANKSMKYHYLWMKHGIFTLIVVIIMILWMA